MNVTGDDLCESPYAESAPEHSAGAVPVADLVRYSMIASDWLMLRRWQATRYQSLGIEAQIIRVRCSPRRR